MTQLLALFEGLAFEMLMAANSVVAMANKTLVVMAVDSQNGGCGC